MLRKKKSGFDFSVEISPRKCFIKYLRTIGGKWANIARNPFEGPCDNGSRVEYIHAFDPFHASYISDLL